MASKYKINTTDATLATTSELVSSDALRIFFIATTATLIPMCGLGVITNCMNIIAYAVIGFQDYATIYFFALSVSDLVSIVIFLAITVSCLIKIHVPDLPVNIFDLVYILSSYLNIVNDISSVLKTYIAIQQGCCVALPFHVKHLFTRRRNTAIVVSVYMFCIACYLPSVCLKSLREVTDPSTNRTEIALYLTNGWIPADSFVIIFNRTILICTCHILILISLLIIASGLSASLRYQQHALVGDYSKIDPRNGRRDDLQKPDLTPTDMDQNTAQYTVQGQLQPVERKLHWKSKELRILKQVTMVSGIFFACNIPAVVIAIANRVVPDFEYRDIYNNLIWVLFTCSYFARLLNSSTTYFIYCHFNSKFSETVRKLLRLKAKQ